MLKIKPGEIAFDIDGVVADTMSSFIYVARKEFGITGIKKEQITSYWLEECLPIPGEIIAAIIKRILEDPFGTNLSPMKGAMDVLGEISRHSRLVFVTARPVKEPIEKWLHVNLKGVPRERVEIIATGKHEVKAEILKEQKVCYFLEDHLDTCKRICEIGLKAIVYDHPWNRGPTPFLRIKNWNELKGLISFADES